MKTGSKNKAGRPSIPFSSVSNRKPDGLTGSPSIAPAGEGNEQLNSGGKVKKVKGGAAAQRMDKKRRGVMKRASGGNTEPDDSPLPASAKGKSAKSDDGEPDMDPQEKASGGGIHIKKSHKGLLHKDMGIPSGEKISEKKLESEKKSAGPAERKRIQFAENAKTWNKK